MLRDMRLELSWSNRFTSRRVTDIEARRSTDRERSRVALIAKDLGVNIVCRLCAAIADSELTFGEFLSFVVTRSGARESNG